MLKEGKLYYCNKPVAPGKTVFFGPLLYLGVVPGTDDKFETHEFLTPSATTVKYATCLWAEEEFDQIGF